MRSLSPRSIEVHRLRFQLVQLRAQGLSFTEIAEQLGLGSALEAERELARALARARIVSAEAMRTLEDERLHQMTQVLWPKVRRGQLNAVGAVLAIMQRRAEMFGLDAPKKVDAKLEADVHHHGDEELLGKLQRIVEGTGHVVQDPVLPAGVPMSQVNGTNGHYTQAEDLDDLADL